MAPLKSRDIEYYHGDQRLLGSFCAPAGDAPRPGILVVHGAMGIDEHIIACTEKVAALGYAVLAVDLWGNRCHPQGPSQIDELIGSFAGDRTKWMNRLAAGRQALTLQPEVDTSRIGAVGYCFGGASVLEYIRTGGETRGGVSLHGGLDLVASDWSKAKAGSNVLICTGAEDPMAKTEELLRVQSDMSQANVSWEVDIYSHAKHAFTEPDDINKPPFAAYDAKADRRSWQAMSAFFKEVFSR